MKVRATWSPGHNARIPAEQRFWAKIAYATYGCWIWTDRLDEDGYGHLRVGSKSPGAHRYAYELLVGDIPAGLTIDHLCRNPACVNPAHLEPVPSGVNVMRGDTPAARNAAKTHCKHGHPFSEENTRRLHTGQRVCITCHRRISREYQRRRRAAQ